MSGSFEKLMLQIGIVDNVTRPLANIDKGIARTSAGWGKMAGGVAAITAVGMALYGALDPAIQMDRALGEVASLGVVQTALQGLSQTALEFSMDYGKSATEFVKASYDIQSAIAGLSGKELSTFTQSSAVLAAAIKSDTGTITSYMGTMYGTFKEKAAQMGKANWVQAIAGKTATAVQMFKTTGNAMSAAFTNLGRQATTAGIAMDEQFAILGHLQSSMGGDAAGTAYKSFLAAVPNAGKVLGMTFTDAKGKMLPMVAILDKLKAKFGSGTLGVDALGKLGQAFGQTGIGVVTALMSDTAALSGEINALGKAKGMAKAEEMAGAMTDQWERLGAVSSALKTKLMGSVLAPINKVAKAFADGGAQLEKWMDMFPNLTKLLGKVALGLLLITGAAGAWAVISGVSAVATGVLGTAVGAAATAFTALLWPLALLALGAAALIYYWKPVSAFFAGMWDTLGPVVNELWTPFAVVLSDVAALFGELINWAAPFFKTMDAGAAAMDGARLSGQSFGEALAMMFKIALWPMTMLMKGVHKLLEMLDLIPGVSVDTSGMGELPDLTQQVALQRQNQLTTAPLASQISPGQTAVPAGGIGQQLIQANASAQRGNAGKTITVGEQHYYFQNPMTPAQLAQEDYMVAP
ncbi:phage tail tape measure protein [Aeromonas enteropelogenes]|uniref:phage tail tape measure protein n=1 Tax=Aeromonas enteropelogenes TaxID=29489 RepID=UPI003BA37A71